MSLRLVTPPTEYPITLEQAKAQCRRLDNNEDDLLEEYIAEATDLIEQHTGLALMPQTWELVLDDFSDTIKLPKGPVRSITSVSYYDDDDVLQTVTNTNFALDNTSDPAWLVRASDFSWPSVASGVNNVIIRLELGYADAESIPSLLIAAVKLAVSAQHENRTNPDFKGAIGCADRFRPVFV